MWTFKTRYLGSDWIVSAQRFPTISEAADEARHWIVTSAENGILAEVVLAAIDD